MAEGGFGGNSAMPERIQKEAAPAACSVRSRSQPKSFLFLLEEKIRRAQTKKCEENFLAGWRALASGGGAASISRGPAQRKFGFRPKGTANLQFQHFGEMLPRGFAARQARFARQSPILRGFATLRVAKRKRLGFGFGSSFGQSPKFRKAEPTNLFSFRQRRNIEAIIFNILTA
jgi:hypothetical protein